MSDKEVTQGEGTFSDLLDRLNILKPIGAQQEVVPSDEHQAEEAVPEGILNEQDKQEYGYPSNWTK